MLLQVDYCCQDGTIPNRQLINSHFSEDPRQSHFTCPNKCHADKKLTFIVDPKVIQVSHTVSFESQVILVILSNAFAMTILIHFQHNHKEIRNNVLSSGCEGYHMKHLQPLNVGPNASITWSHWIQAWHWDQTKHSVPIFPQLSVVHLYPNQQEKMRTPLAEDCLGHSMLHLMKVGFISTTSWSKVTAP